MSPDSPTVPGEDAVGTGSGPTRPTGWIDRARSVLGAVGERLARRWWHEPPKEVRRRWQRFLLHGPIGLLVGLSFGILAGRRWGIDPVILGMVCGAGGVVFMYLVGQAESWLRNGLSGKRGLPGPLVQVVADVVGGGLMGWGLSTVLDSDAAASLAMGASVLAAYSYVASRFLWGTFVEDLVWFLTGNAASARRPDYSREKALAARGQVDEALDLYEQACERRPGHADPMIHAAWMLREAGRYEEAVEWYRRALDTPLLDGRRASIFCRHVWEIAATKLDEPERALPDLERLLERYPDGDDLAWARREVEEMRETDAGRPIPGGGAG